MLMIVLALAIFGWVVCLALFLNHLPKATKVENLSPADAIIVLTGGERRIPFGLTLLEAKKGEKLFISGVHNKVDDDTVFRTKTAEIYAQYLAMREHITLGREATSTKENAIEVAEWLKDKPELKNLLIVTDHFHMPRSMMELRSKLPDRTLSSAPVLPPEFAKEKWWMDRYPLSKILQEFHKFSVVFLTQQLARLA